MLKTAIRIASRLNMTLAGLVCSKCFTVHFPIT
jgi:hypothetical protein